MDVVAWLRRLGLEQYAPAFRDNDIDGEVLPELTPDDLISIGVTSVGHRRRLVAAIAALRDEPARVSNGSTRGEKPSFGTRTTADAERRHLTVIFCDLVGSTPLAASLDPEDLREVIADYHRAVTETVARFDGFVAKYMGDGVLIYFGYPQAHEDDAERAVRAGLGVIDVVGRLDVRPVKLQARVGIATGSVVVGDLIGEGSAREQSVVGKTPNLAARLQALAEPGAVVISRDTRRLVGDLFECRDLGMVEVKGIAEPVTAWQVLRPSVVESRFEALRGAALTRLIGRDEEIELLLRRWARANAGEGQVVLMSGEAGLGKSRLVAALEQRLDADPHLRVRYFCSPYNRDSALFPFVDQLSRASGFARDDPPACRLEKLEAVLRRATPPDEDLGLLADLLSLPGSERHKLPPLTPQRKKQRTLEALIRQLDGMAHQQPLVVTVEDAHWIDPTSRELLDLAVEWVRNRPALLIVTFRPEFQPPWTGLAQVNVLTLNRLGRRDRTALVNEIAGGKALPDEVVAQIVERADGVPLFIEELTKGVLESGLLREEADRYVLDGALPPLAIPTTLHDSLMARLDRLASVRVVAQTGAAIGREFSYELLQTVCRLPEDELQAALARLVASELVFQRGVPPDAVYTFKHALVQDAAHGSLLRSSRQQLHARIAEALETQSPELMDTQPELFAQHYAEAGLVEQSASCWALAGRRSVLRSATSEAAAQFQKGLDQLALLPETPERRRQELEFCCALGAVLRAVKGNAAPEVGQALTRARELWEQLGSPLEFLHVAYLESRYRVFRGELNLVLQLDEKLLRLGSQRNDPLGLVLGHTTSGLNLLAAGRFASSRLHLEEALALCGSISHDSLIHQIGIHPYGSVHPWLGIALFCLGFPDQGLARISASSTDARKLAHPPTFVTGVAGSARLLALVEDNVALDACVTELLALASEHGFLLNQAMGTVFSGWVKVNSGDVGTGLALMRKGWAAWRATEAEGNATDLIALLARGCAMAGQVEEAMTLVDEALQIADRTGERFRAAELNRQKGQLLLRRGDSHHAEELYRKALSIAQEQGAKLWELRATASLARLRRDQGRRSEGRDLLTPVYGWFTEGFGTPDLKDAKALLDELS